MSEHKKTPMEKYIGTDFVVKSWLVFLKVLKNPTYDGVTGMLIPGVGLVLKLGEEAFLDKSRFPFNNKCSEGDIVYFSDYEWLVKVINNTYCAFCPDTSIVAVVKSEDLKNWLLGEYKGNEEVKVSA